MLRIMHVITLLFCSATFATSLTPQQEVQIAQTCRLYLNHYSNGDADIPANDQAKMANDLSLCITYGSCQKNLSDIPECSRKLSDLAIDVELAGIPTSAPTSSRTEAAPTSPSETPTTPAATPITVEPVTPTTEPTTPQRTPKSPKATPTKPEKKEQIHWF